MQLWMVFQMYSFRHTFDKNPNTYFIKIHVYHCLWLSCSFAIILCNYSFLWYLSESSFVSRYILPDTSFWLGAFALLEDKWSARIWPKIKNHKKMLKHVVSQNSARYNQEVTCITQPFVKWEKTISTIAWTVFSGPIRSENLILF